MYDGWVFECESKVGLIPGELEPMFTLMSGLRLRGVRRRLGSGLTRRRVGKSGMSNTGGVAVRYIVLRPLALSVLLRVS